MSKYLEGLKAALSLTENCPFGSDDYQDGWCCAKEDILYGLSLGSEDAIQAQMAAWLIEPNNPYYETLDSQSDKGYCERVRAINNLMENMK